MQILNLTTQSQLYPCIETAPSSYGSKAIFQHMKNEELKIQVAISAGLTCLIRELWSNLTKTTRRDLSGNIVVLKARLQRLKNATYFLKPIETIPMFFRE